uniref:Coiled-coil and C2 domain-containing protein 1B n=1 Tax=Latimeria chalumnae TaxID=7897 RepID=H3AVE0_LATCH
MLGKKNKKDPQAKGQGAAVAKQLGLFVDFNPEEMALGMDSDGDDGDLEMELAALTGKKAAAKPKAKGKTPLPMADIEKMAEDCMKDIDEDDNDEDLENDEDLLAELQEVVGEEEEGENEMETTESPGIANQPPTQMVHPVTEVESKLMSPACGLQKTLEDRIEMYKASISNAKEAGETSKVRRYERGLKTLETMLVSVKKGKKINEEEIPPLVAVGKSVSTVPQPGKEQSENTEVASASEAETSDDAVASLEKALQPLLESHLKDGIVMVLKHFAGSDNVETRVLLISRQKEYKLAALKAKQEGDIEKARKYLKIGKKFDAVIGALDNGQPIDLANMPPAPGDLDAPEKLPSSSTLTKPAPVETSELLGTAIPSAPAASDVLEALQQRLEKYKSAAAQAKAAGDDRKGRMHERIAKVINREVKSSGRGNKNKICHLKKCVGFPPIPGIEGSGGDQGIIGVLEAASKLANTEAKEEEDAEDDEPPVAKKPVHHHEKPVQLVTPMPAAPSVEKSPKEVKKNVSASPLLIAREEKLTPQMQLSSTAQQQLEFLQKRKKQYMKAAVQAKQKNDREQAKLYLRTAKGFDPMIEAVENGKAIDISKVPSPPTDEDDDDFILVHHKDVVMSQKTEEVYLQLAKLLKEQYEKCMQYSKQFTHLGNVVETTRFRPVVGEIKNLFEISCYEIQNVSAEAMATPPLSYFFCDANLLFLMTQTSLFLNRFCLFHARGPSFPAPTRVALNDLDAFVKFEFPYPSTEQPQKNKTSVIKNTNCPEYNQSFTLTINRNHRGFRRAIQTKGIKFELFHKGGFLRSDKPVGTAQLKLERLETVCEIREILEVFESRKATGGKLEVRVRLREPLSGQDIQTVTERWLILEQNKKK